MRSFTISLRLMFCLLSLYLFAGCASTTKVLGRTTDAIVKSPFYETQFTGFMLFDPSTRDTLYNLNGHKYFTPASNTKIFTLYTALQLLPDRIPSLKYVVRNDTLYAEGTGDPTSLHPHFKDSTAIKFLKKHTNVVLHLNNIEDDKLGPGWSWGDYQYYYQAERSSLPLYGNTVTISNVDSIHVVPAYFKDSVIPINYSKNRDLESNSFYYAPFRIDTTEIPYRTDSTLTKNLLESVLGKKIRLTQTMPKSEKSMLYGMTSDSVYKRMMHESDNFLAEQLLLLAASTLSDTLNTNDLRDHVLENLLPDLKQPPRWVDGSGLSRYNLFSPASMVQVLDKLYQGTSRQRLFTLFPAGGVSGTLKSWYEGNPEPYVYAKTGSLSNNHCLSGYLITKSGRTLIFSFMNNHFRRSSSEVKERMQAVLEQIHELY